MAGAAAILALDIGSGGASAALVDRRLAIVRIAEEEWALQRDESGEATLSPRAALDAIEASVCRAASAASAPEALVLSSMMHTLVVTDESGVPLTPVHTWLDMAGFPDAMSLRTRLGDDYNRRTGAWFHPSFPAWKLARLQRRPSGAFPAGHRIHSLRSWVQHAWTGEPSEDVSTASASGLLNLESGDWDAATLTTLGVDPAGLPEVVPTTSVYRLAARAADRLGLPPGLPVVAGGGDGFLAALGSGCEDPDRLAITLGTTSAVRRFQPTAADVRKSGMFCYRYRPEAFLAGCASSNGGNVLDWARQEFDDGPVCGDDPPVCLPWVFGERAPFWDTNHRPRWLGLGEAHGPDDLRRSVVEGVAFTMAVHTELVGADRPPRTGVLSGNGFQNESVARILATLVPFPLRIPPDAGSATLRGAARIGFEALGIDTAEAVEDLEAHAVPVTPLALGGPTEARFDRFRTAYMSSKSDA